MINKKYFLMLPFILTVFMFGCSDNEFKGTRLYTEYFYSWVTEFQDDIIDISDNWLNQYEQDKKYYFATSLSHFEKTTHYSYGAEIDLFYGTIPEFFNHLKKKWLESYTIGAAGEYMFGYALVISTKSVGSGFEVLENNRETILDHFNTIASEYDGLWDGQHELYIVFFWHVASESRVSGLSDYEGVIKCSYIDADDNWETDTQGCLQQFVDEDPKQIIAASIIWLPYSDDLSMDWSHDMKMPIHQDVFVK